MGKEEEAGKEEELVKFEGKEEEVVELDVVLRETKLDGNFDSIGEIESGKMVGDEEIMEILVGLQKKKKSLKCKKKSE